MAKEKKKMSTFSKVLLGIGFGILAAGAIAFGVTSAIGMLLLARDLFFVAFVLDVGVIGVGLGKAIVTGIANAITGKNQKQSKSKSVSRLKNRSKSKDVEIEKIPEPENKASVNWMDWAETRDSKEVSPSRKSVK